MEVVARVSIAGKKQAGMLLPDYKCRVEWLKEPANADDSEKLLLYALTRDLNHVQPMAGRPCCGLLPKPKYATD